MKIFAKILFVLFIFSFFNSFYVEPTFAATITLRPNAAGARQNWFVVGITHYGATSDQIDTTYVYDVAEFSDELENLQNSSNLGTINSVIAFIRCKAVGGGGAAEKASVYWNTGVLHASTPITITRATFADYSETRTTHPDTGSAWTWSQINSLQVGSRIEQLGFGEVIQCSEFWIVVDYTPPVVDTTPPTWSSNSVNTTFAGNPALFFVQYNDNNALQPNGKYIFSTNNTGTWVNDSSVSWISTPQWANISKTLNSTPGLVIGYRWYANDSAGNVNNTPIFTLTTTAPPSGAPIDVAYYNFTLPYAVAKAFARSADSGTVTTTSTGDSSNPPLWTQNWDGFNFTAAGYTFLTSPQSSGGNAKLTSGATNNEPFGRFNFTLNMTLHPLSNIQWLYVQLRQILIGGAASNEPCTYLMANFTNAGWFKFDSDLTIANAATRSLNFTDVSEISKLIDTSNNNQLVLGSQGVAQDSGEGCAVSFVSVRVGYTPIGATLKDQIRFPCSTNIQTAGDNCTPRFNPGVNTNFNVSFRLRNASTTAGILDKTMMLRYGPSTDPRTNQAGINIQYNASGCGPNQRVIMTATPFVEACSGAICSSTTNPDFKVNQSTLTVGYDINITFPLRFCRGTEGIAYDLAIGSNESGTGTIIADSFLTIVPHVITAWNKTTNNFIESSPAIGNVNGDSFQDVIIGSDDYNLYAINGSNGAQLWAYGTVNSPVLGAPALADIDGDLQLDVVFGTCTNESTASTTYSNRIFALNGNNGSQKWNFSTGGCVLSSPAIANLTVEGTKYVFISSFDDKKIWTINGTNGLRIWNFTANGSFVASPTLADGITGDSGKPEVYIGSYDGNMYALNATNGNKLWNYTVGALIETTAAVDDVDNNGTKSVVFGAYNGIVYQLNANNGALEKASSGNIGQLVSSPIIANVQPDSSYKEVIIGSPFGTVYVLNGSNSTSVYTPVWNFTLTTGGRADSSPAIADVDNDTFSDIVIGGSDGFLYAIRGIDGTELWNYSIGGNIPGSPAIGDVNNDGENEIIVGSFNRNITTIDPGGVTIMDQENWNMFGGNMQRTRILDDVSPELEFFVINDPSTTPQLISKWKDIFSQLAFADIEEDSSGTMEISRIPINSVEGWANYTFKSIFFDRNVFYKLTIYDIYGNSRTISGNFLSSQAVGTFQEIQKIAALESQKLAQQIVTLLFSVLIVFIVVLVVIYLLAR